MAAASTERADGASGSSSHSSSIPARTLPARPPPPPILIFDDGSRSVLPPLHDDDDGAAGGQTRTTSTAESGATARTKESTNASTNPRGTVSVRDYYELERLTAEILWYYSSRRRRPSSSTASTIQQPPLVVVALQFPDDQLCDAPHVSWALQAELEQRWSQPTGTTSRIDDDDDDPAAKQVDTNEGGGEINTTNTTTAAAPEILVCILGDTTFAACCPDTVAAAHVNASILIHFGHACLSSSSSSDNCSSCAATTSGNCSSDNAETATTPAIPTMESSNTMNCTNACHVLYSFGKQAIRVNQCVNAVRDHCQQQEQGNDKETAKQQLLHRFILLYEVQYHHGMEELRLALSSSLSFPDGMAEVLVGTVPSTASLQTTAIPTIPTADSGETHKDPTIPPTQSNAASGREQRAWDSNTNGEPVTLRCAANSSCCRTAVPDETWDTAVNPSPLDSCVETDPLQPLSMLQRLSHSIVGGLEMPPMKSDALLSNYTILYIGNDRSRQFLNIVLRFISSSQDDRPRDIWTWSPNACHLQTTLSPSFSRILNRRFYLVQRAQQCRVFGILVAQVTEPIRQLVESLRRLVADRSHGDLTSYTFVVGKINPAKLANFPEIDCFILTACPEHSLLSNERELYHVPIITPCELLVALGITDWSTSVYSMQPCDFWDSVASLFQKASIKRRMKESESALIATETDFDCEDDDDDAPYFSLVTGKFEAKHNYSHGAASFSQEQQLSRVDADGTCESALTVFQSAAGEFLGAREYQGLVLASDIGSNAESNNQRAVHAAIAGHFGIASNYDNR